MNKLKVIGIVMLVIGIGTHFSVQSVFPDFAKGVLIGAGIVLLLTGKKTNADTVS